MLAMRLAIFMLFISCPASADRDANATRKNRQSSRVASLLRLMQNHRLQPAPEDDGEWTAGDKNVYGATTAKCGTSQCGIDPPAIHAICVDLPPKFCEETGQPDWCSAEAQQPHCVCLGAWSLYVSKGNAVPEVHCDAIPAPVFSDKYISSWSTWNGKELAKQEKNGLERLFDQCHKGDGAAAFKEKYCTFVSGAAHLSDDEKTEIKSKAKCTDGAVMTETKGESTAVRHPVILWALCVLFSMRV